MGQINKDYFDINEDMKANTIDDILVEGEQKLVELTPHKKTFILESFLKGLPFALLWGGFDAFFIVMMITTGAFNEMGGTAMIFVIIGFFVIHLIPVWLYIAGIIKKLAGYKNIKYVLTDKRIIIRSGLIGIDFKIFYYSEIDSIDVKVGLLDRIFKVGDLYIKSKTQSAVIEDIKAPYAYSSKIQKIILDIKADIEFPNDYRPDKNSGYNTNYIADEKDK